MSKPPQRSKQREQEQLGLGYVDRIVKRAGSEFRPIHLEHDYGLDGEIQLFRRRQHTGLYVYVQVKTGGSYFARLSQDGTYIYLRNIKAGHKDLWRRANVPVLLIWVDTRSTEVKAYWGMVPEIFDGNRTRLEKRLVFGVHSLAEIEQRLLPPQKKETPEPLQLTPLVALGSRGQPYDLLSEAKKFYRQWHQLTCTSPILGSVAISRRGWRKITAPSRGKEQIEHSLKLLPLAKAIIEQQKAIQGYRTVSVESDRGYQVTRAHLYLVRRVEFTFRNPAIVVVKLEEVRKFPSMPFVSLPSLESLWIKRRFLTVYERRHV